MAIRDLYFSRSVFRGIGKLFLLKIPLLAPANSSVRALLGSYVEEIDGGLFSTKEAPGIDHVWEPEYALKEMANVPALAGKSLKLNTSLAGVQQDFKIESNVDISAGASFPGAPVSLGAGVSYKKLKRGTVMLGAGATKYYIPRDFTKAAYEHFAEHSDSIDRVAFHPDRMLVDQILLASSYSVSVVSETTFDANFEAKAEAINKVNAGVKYSRVSNREYKVEVNDGNEYVIALGAIEADELAD